jgi:hypothetical protein
MEQQQMIWLSTSLFSSIANWHHILKEGVRPFIKSNKRVKGYTIEFNYLSGQNIRLALLTNEDEKQQVAQNADAYFKHYFATANLQQLPVKLPVVGGVFLPFPGNTIQYGLYPPVIVASDKLDQYTLPITVSKIMIAVLEDDIDDETILTLAYYLQISLVKTIYQLTGNERDLFATIEQANNFNADDNALSNLSLMKEITEDVMQTERFDSELDWLNSWIDDCKTAFLSVNKTEQDTNAPVRSIYKFWIQTICYQLGINTYARHMLNYFVAKSLEQHFLVRK